MKISKGNLKKLIESFVFEQDATIADLYSPADDYDPDKEAEKLDKKISDSVKENAPKIVNTRNNVNFEVSSFDDSCKEGFSRGKGDFEKGRFALKEYSVSISDLDENGKVSKTKTHKFYVADSIKKDVALDSSDKLVIVVPTPSNKFTRVEKYVDETYKGDDPEMKIKKVMWAKAVKLISEERTKKLRD
jgi:hypothetical protein